MAPSTDTSGMEFEVFLSFRGSDTRDNFASCLYHDMVEKGIRVFRDDKELQVGEKIEELLKALDDSQIYIPIFSQDFASSKWCLDEVSRMLDRTSNSGGKKEICPIFLDVKPEDVKSRKRSYSEALSEHEKERGPAVVNRWREDLREVTSRVGWKLEGKEYGELIKLIVREVLLKLKGKDRHLPDHLVETDDLECIEKLLDVDSDDLVRFFIIHGTGGIGKSTLASVIFNRFRSQFDCCSFLGDVQSHPVLDMQKKLLSETVGSNSAQEIYDTNDGIYRIARGLGKKKVLVVVDNVDDKKQLDNLAGSCDWFGRGSRIIVTLRDMRIIRNEGNKESKTLPSNYLAYPVMEMPIDQAIQLFSKHAFRRDTPPKGCYDFSRGIVSSIGRLPLTLEVVGSLFANTARSEWNETWEDLKQVPHKDVRETLMMSINKLDKREKAIFLDIACFCIGERRTYANYMWRSVGYSPRSAIDDLLLLSLIKIDYSNRFWMHDEVRDVGRYMVKEENIEEVGDRRWIRIDGNTLDILRGNKEKRDVQALSLDILHELTPEELACLPKLRFLGGERLNFVGDFKNLHLNLRWLSCHPLPDFSATNLHLVKLVVLDLSRSCITADWGGWRQIEMAKELKILDLTGCFFLDKTPDFSKLGKLEELILEDCQQLSKIDSSIGKLKLLHTLNIGGCYSLTELPEEIGSLERLSKIIMPELGSSFKFPETLGNLRSLRKFEIYHNYRIRYIIQLPHSFKFPKTLGNLTHLVLSGCYSLRELPDSIGELNSLIMLDLGFSRISTLPDSIGRLTNLMYLVLHHCQNLRELPDSIVELEALVKLDLDTSGISTLPDSIGRLKNLERLNLYNCHGLHQLPDSIGQMELLVKLDVHYSGITVLPNSIGNLKRLKVLRVGDTKIRTIPCSLGGVETLEELQASFCWHLVDEILWELWSLTSLRILNLEQSPISSLPRNISRLSSLQTLKIATHRLSPLPELPSSLECLVVAAAEFSDVPDLSSLVLLHRLELTFFTPEELTPEELTLPWKDPQSIDRLPPSLSTLPKLSFLSIKDCLEPRLPDLSRLKHLEELWLTFFPELVEIPGLGELESLKFLHIFRCDVIKQLPSLSKLRNLSRLELKHCAKLRAVEGLKELKNLGKVKIRCCMSLERLPDVPASTKLEIDWMPL